MDQVKKEEMMSKYAELKKTIEGEFFDSVFEYGKEEGTKEGFAAGKDSVVVPVEGGEFDQAAMDKYADQKVAEAKAADTTKFGQEDMDAMQAKVDAAKAEAAKFQANDSEQEAALAKFNEVFTGIEALLHPAVKEETPELPEGNGPVLDVPAPEEVPSEL